MSPASMGIPFEKSREADLEATDDIRPDSVVQHRGRADLNRSAPEQKVVERVLEAGDPPDAREAPVGKRLRQLRDLRERQRKDGRAAEAAGRDEAVHVN